MELRIIVAGSRDFTDYPLLAKELDQFIADHSGYDQVVIISGTARGADKLGEAYARIHGYRCDKFPADWNAHGRSAGHIRNREMAKYSHADGNKGCLVAFWDGQSRGTKGMIDYATMIGIETKVVRFDV